MHISRVYDAAAEMLKKEFDLLLIESKLPYEFTIHREDGNRQVGCYKLRLGLSRKWDDELATGYITFLTLFENKLLVKLSVRCPPGTGDGQYWRAEDIIIEASAKAILPRLEMNIDREKIVENVMKT